MSLTVILGFLIFLLQASPGYLFWIAIGCLILIGLQQTGFVSLVAKRTVIIDKEGKITINDIEGIKKDASK